MRLLTSAMVATLALALAGPSCAVEGFELVDGSPPVVPPQGGAGGVGGSGGGASGGGGGGGAPGCGSKTYPEPPQGADAGGDLDFVVAIDSVDFGEGDVSDGPQVGYDLDGRCSCIEEGQSCVAPDPDRQSCDGPGGVDNAVADLFAPIAILDPNFGSPSFRQDIQDGVWSVLLRIQGYNGEANDAQVTVALYPSGGLDNDPCGDGSPPAWDGTDAWPIGISALETPMGGGGGAGGCGSTGVEGYSHDEPRYVDPGAYVVDSVLVASLPALGLAFDGGATVRLSGGFITGRIVAEGGGYRIDDGVLAGRWALSDVFETLAILGSDDMPRCTDDQTYQTLRGALCDKRDLTAQLAGPTAPCDAVSFGMAFTATPAQLGFIYDDTANPIPNCPDELAPANDSCD